MTIKHTVDVFFHQRDEKLEHIEKIVERILRVVIRDSAAEVLLAQENADLRQQLQDLLTGVTLPPEVQAKVDAVFAKVKANTEALAKKVEDNKEVS